MCKCNLMRLSDPIYFPFLLVQAAFGIRQLQSVYWVLLIRKVIPPKYLCFSEQLSGRFAVFHWGLWHIKQKEGVFWATTARSWSFSDQVPSGSAVESSWNPLSLAKLLWEMQIDDTVGLMNSYLLSPLLLPGDILSYMCSGARFQKLNWQKTNLIETIIPCEEHQCAQQVCSVYQTH